MHPSVTPNIIWAIRLRYRLLPYLYSLYRQAAVQHVPLLRPTFFEFGEDPETWRENHEVMLGPFLLAAPVLYPTARHRQVRSRMVGGACFCGEYKLQQGFSH